MKIYFSKNFPFFSKGSGFFVPLRSKSISFNYAYCSTTHSGFDAPRYRGAARGFPADGCGEAHCAASCPVV